MTPAVIDLHELTVTVGGRSVLDRVTATVTERRLGVIGPNGSGKSTLARVLGGLTAPTSGSVSVVGIDPARNGREARSRIGFCFADPDAQIVMPTVREDVDFSLRRSGLDRATRAARVSTALHRFGLSHLADAPAHRLSSGEKQLLALAASLVREPELLICDEPTTLLDLRNARAMAGVLWALTEEGHPDTPWASQVAPALVVVSHDLDLVRECDRVLRLEDGVLVDDGTPDEVIGSYREDMATR